MRGTARSRWWTASSPRSTTGCTRSSGWATRPARRRSASCAPSARRSATPTSGDYAKLVVDRGPFIGNVARAQAFATARNLERIGRPVDRDEWRMTTPTVNASYNSSLNDITFPAGILQPPFFDPAADDAVNYGGMGAVIGHEMT